MINISSALQIRDIMHPLQTNKKTINKSQVYSNSLKSSISYDESSHVWKSKGFFRYSGRTLKRRRVYLTFTMFQRELRFYSSAVKDA
jgi:hypothetical protein